jgi:hypothetical protein
VPNEKRVAETGVRYPIKTYREKTAQEMIESHREMQKPPLTVRRREERKRKEIMGCVCVAVCVGHDMR